MKKKFILLTITLVLILSLCGCGGDDAPNASDSSQPSEQSPAGEIHTLTDWYNSDDRIQLEASYADFAQAMGMTYFVTVQEPDTLIIHYQFLEQLDFGNTTQEEINEIYAQSMKDYLDTIRPVFDGFREEYGILLNVVRLIYQNADGTLITSMDFTPENAAVPDDSSEELSGRLADWLRSEEADAIVEEVNRSLTYSGMTFRLSAEGNVLVYEYHVSETLGLKNLSSEERSRHLDNVVESQREGILSLFDLFRSEYDIRLDAVKIVFLSEDGSEILYTSQLP